MNRPTIEGPDVRVLFWYLDGTKEVRSISPDSAALDVYSLGTFEGGSCVLRYFKRGIIATPNRSEHKTLVVFTEESSGRCMHDAPRRSIADLVHCSLCGAQL